MGANVEKTSHNRPAALSVACTIETGERVAQIPRHVLEIWQSHHGKLATLSLMRKFLARREASAIGNYPEQWIRHAFSHEKRLLEALLILRWRSAIVFTPNRSAKDQNQPSDSKDSGKLQGSPPAVRSVARDAEHKLDVVGESFYRDSFDALRKSRAVLPSSTIWEPFELELDPNNPFSASGKAVKVVLDSFLIGFVPEQIAPAVFSIIENQTGRAWVPGEIWFDSREAAIPRNSARVIPPGTYERQKRKSLRTQPVEEGATQSQADMDAAAWRMAHPSSRPMEPVWFDRSGGRQKDSPNKVRPKAIPAPFKMQFFCRKCTDNAGSRARECLVCGARLGVPRHAGKTLAASKARGDDEKANKRRSAANKNNQRKST